MRNAIVVLLLAAAASGCGYCIADVGPSCAPAATPTPTLTPTPPPACAAPVVGCDPVAGHPGLYRCVVTPTAAVNWTVNGVGQGDPRGLLEAKSGDTVAACAPCGPCSPPFPLH